MAKSPRLTELEKRLGYKFSDKALLERALTHVSAAGAHTGANYQRLEFLGDRVLGLVVAEVLCRTFQEATEGELSRRLAELVRKESCAEVAIAWEVGPHLRLGASEMQSGGRKNTAILADICESILGAIFIDGGYNAAKAVIEEAFRERVTAPRRPLHDAKTALQEWAQGLGLPTPVYDLVERTGPDHAPQFRIAARVSGRADSIGHGPSKRVAEQNAAQGLLIREGVWKENGDDKN
ncbi:ribonuclease III [Microvirga sp. W0021]|uniref:Ribonuclease 3 n=1 Tax=Hohaiivirga grylli TaxID=3133970 RepID=A0ABV0BK14_9HYPH